MRSGATNAAAVEVELDQREEAKSGRFCFWSLPRGTILNPDKAVVFLSAYDSQEGPGLLLVLAE